MRYKVDDVVLCVSNKLKIIRGIGTFPITIGKYYNIIKEDDTICYIINDYGKMGSYAYFLFKDKCEIREFKIEQILNDN